MFAIRAEFTAGHFVRSLRDLNQKSSFTNDFFAKIANSGVYGRGHFALFNNAEVTDVTKYVLAVTL